MHNAHATFKLKVLSNFISCSHVQCTFFTLCIVYTAIDTYQLVKEIDMLLFVIKATKPIIKNVMSLDNYLVSGVAIYFIRLKKCEFNNILKFLTS